MREEQYIYDQYLKKYEKVRIFLSSTFDDMKIERDLIIIGLAPKLKEWARKFYIDLEFIDLRWGVSIEEQYNGRTLPICLKAIDECIPFFIALVAENMGTKVDYSSLNENIRELIDNPENEKNYNFSENIKGILEFLRNNKNQDRYYTEMEILYALTQNHESSLFLLRNNLNASEATLDENIRELRNTIRNFGAIEYNYSDSRDSIGYDNSKNGEIKFSSNLLTDIKGFVERKCIERFGKKRFSYDDRVERALANDYFEYNKHKEYLMYSGELLMAMNQFWKTDSHIFKINCADGDRDHFITQVVYLLINEYDIDFVFSYDSFTAYEFGNRLSNFIRFNGIMPGAIKGLPIEPEILKIQKKLVVAIAPEGLESVYTKYGTDNVVYITFEDFENATNIIEFTPKPLTYIEKRNYIETQLKNYCKKLSDAQVNAIAKSRKISTCNDLYAIVKDLIEITDFASVKNMIMQRFADGLDEEDLDYADCSLAELRNIYNSYVKELTKVPFIYDYATINKAYSELISVINKYYFIAQTISLDNEMTKNELSEIVGFAWLLGIQITTYLNVKLEKMGNNSLDDAAMECEYELYKVKDNQISLLHYMGRLNISRFDQLFKDVKYPVYDFSVVDDFLARTVKEQYELLDSFATMKIVNSKNLKVVLRYAYEYPPITAYPLITAKRIINVYTPHYYTASFKTLEEYPSYCIYTPGGIDLK